MDILCFQFEVLGLRRVYNFFFVKEVFYGFNYEVMLDSIVKSYFIEYKIYRLNLFKILRVKKG